MYESLIKNIWKKMVLKKCKKQYLVTASVISERFYRNILWQSKFYWNWTFKEISQWITAFALVMKMFLSVSTKLCVLSDLFCSSLLSVLAPVKQWKQKHRFKGDI